MANISWNGTINVQVSILHLRSRLIFVPFLDCTDLIFGCSECRMQADGGWIQDQLHCNVCDYGYYMLTLDDTLAGEKYPDGNWLSINQKMRNVCVKRCEDFAHNYVSNPNTMKCECKKMNFEILTKFL